MSLDEHDSLKPLGIGFFYSCAKPDVTHEEHDCCAPTHRYNSKAKSIANIVLCQKRFCSEGYAPL